MSQVWDRYRWITLKRVLKEQLGGQHERYQHIATTSCFCVWSVHRTIVRIRWGAGGKALRIAAGEHLIKLSCHGCCWCYKGSSDTTQGSSVKRMAWQEQELLKPISEELEVSACRSNGLFHRFTADVVDIEVLTFEYNLSGHKKVWAFQKACQC